jgi:hypothetical protein
MSDHPVEKQMLRTETNNWFILRPGMVLAGVVNQTNSIRERTEEIAQKKTNKVSEAEKR